MKYAHMRPNARSARVPIAIFLDASVSSMFRANHRRTESLIYIGNSEPRGLVTLIRRSRFFIVFRERSGGHNYSALWK